MSKDTILVAVDGSDPSEKAVTFASDLCKRTGAMLELVTVIHLAVLEEDAEFYIPDEKMSALRKKAEERSFSSARKAVAQDVEVFETVLQGSPAQVLLEHIEKSKPFMVVLGRTGKSALQRVLEGSVSRKISSLATAPVCVVS